ncbi:FecR domain-containing protein [Reichenbachiella sp. MALMAid0571]|uniref:FecR family protein n=1 Tax=Reichenbachiella sp. MALMAid0571 TaxID=3143939 RepID=UPI0032E055A5
MEENTNYTLISAFLSKQANADQITDLREWLSESETNKLEFEELKEVWLKSHMPYRTENIDILYNRVEAEISGIKKESAKIVPFNDNRRKLILFTKWVAAAILMLVGILWAYNFSDQQKNKQAVAEVHQIIKKNPAGIKTTVRLPDGTVVWLNSESKLNYDSEYGYKNRYVQIEGEAFFEVAKNKDLPFKVFSRGQVIEALGTAFNVRGFVYESQLKVALVEGTVKIQEENGIADKAFILKPGDEYKKHFVSGETGVGKLNYGELSWRSGNIYFKSASMAKVFRTLERWYGVEVIIEKDTDQTWNYTGGFSKETLENVLQSISYSKNFDFEIGEKKVIVRPKKKKI